MEYESEIKRLEDFVGRLLGGYTRLKTDIRLQEQELQSLQVENAELREQIGEMESERGDLGSRVSRLIDRIESWEAELEAVDHEIDQSGDPDDEIKPESKTSKEQAEDDDDAGGGVQGSLFTATSTTG